MEPFATGKSNQHSVKNFACAVQPRVQRLWCGRAAMDGASVLHSFSHRALVHINAVTPYIDIRLSNRILLLTTHHSSLVSHRRHTHTSHASPHRARAGAGGGAERADALTHGRGRRAPRWRPGPPAPARPPPHRRRSVHRRAPRACPYSALYAPFSPHRNLLYSNSARAAQPMRCVPYKPTGHRTMAPPRHTLPSRSVRSMDRNLARWLSTLARWLSLCVCRESRAPLASARGSWPCVSARPLVLSERRGFIWCLSNAGASRWSTAAARQSRPLCAHRPSSSTMK